MPGVVMHLEEMTEESMGKTMYEEMMADVRALFSASASSSSSGRRGGFANTKRKKKRSATKRSRKTNKKPIENWFETCTVSQLKDLCRATNGKLMLSGTKQQLIDRLLSCDDGFITKLSDQSIVTLKSSCADSSMIKSGIKYDLISRLVQKHYGFDSASGNGSTVAASTGGPVVAGKEPTTKAPPAPSPKRIYDRLSKKMNAVNTQKKYKTHRGYKGHPADVYRMMNHFIWDDCLGTKSAGGNNFATAGSESRSPSRLIDTNPMLAYEVALAVFQSFYDNFQVMVDVGYGTDDFRDAVDGFGEILAVVGPTLPHSTSNDSSNTSNTNNEGIEEKTIESTLLLLEQVRACVGRYSISIRSSTDYAVYYSTGEGKDKNDSWYSTQGIQVARKHKRREGQDCINDAIRTIVPDYDQSKRPKIEGKLLDSEIATFKWMIGL
mmetsp:Transcript_28623/g.69522  ORF Transcript_28623/g.69522 Transcript_28623/m.69522 type:complete len:437 (-) Transcript_28623:105-1415(-)